MYQKLPCFVCFKYSFPQLNPKVNYMSEDESVESQEQEECTSEPKKKYAFIEDIPGVGPATSQKLRDIGYHTVESLAMATARELEPIGIGEKKAFVLMNFLRCAKISCG
jgi:ERCC4-type nuclease